MRYVIVGGGVAGTTAAEALRKRDAKSEITLVSEEHHPLYSRVLLPHYLKGKVPRERVFLKKEAWYGQQQIEWLTGIACEHLDPRNQFVGLTDGRELPYDRLLVATGGEVRTVDADLRGVSYLRTLDDADHLAQILCEQPADARAVIFGGGFIACEYLNLFSHFRLPTTLFHRGAHFWTRSLGEEAGALIAKHLTERGVELHTRTQFVNLLGESELTGVVTSQGEHAAHLLGVGIGTSPDFSWLKAAGVDVGAGVRTNAFLETNIPHVYAAGDIAEFFDEIVGRHIQAGNWMNAMSQGRAAAHIMSGEREPFHLVSSYATNALGLEIIFVGDTLKDAADEVRVLGSVHALGVTQIFVRQGRVVGGVLIGRNQDRAAITKAIQEQKTASEFEIC
ncbi:NAD(P)/FAD-dependent oxidoreductase [Candidatus Uhrbacteria bacterium]|nr:NAD(P)/FAD-dependent oxidoreductase [Candidatus Uhrbacteria bacterium]